MTRFARKQGFAEKKEITRKAEEATPWESMLKTDDADNATASADTTDENKSMKRKTPADLEQEKLRAHAQDYDKRIQLENSNSLVNTSKPPPNKKQNTSQDDFYFEKYADSIDKEVLSDLIEMKNKKRITFHEFQDRLMREERSNKRRLHRIDERDAKRVCFRCRKPGHSVNECEEMKKDNEHGTGICYKCGSTEHSVHKCKVKTEPGHYPFAKCFICNEVGHITKQCPDNPRGLYPNGGACKNCSSVEHYARDCPEIQKKNLLAETKTIKKLKPKDNLDILSDAEEETKVDSLKNKKKIVVF